MTRCRWREGRRTEKEEENKEREEERERDRRKRWTKGREGSQK
jgi:hypothetical protein